MDSYFAAEGDNSFAESATTLFKKNLLSSNCSTRYFYDVRDMCNGEFCNYDWNCDSDCCWGK